MGPQSVPQGLKPQIFRGLERPKAKALGYLEAEARLPDLEAKARSSNTPIARFIGSLRDFHCELGSSFDDEGDAVFRAEADGWVEGDPRWRAGDGFEVPIARDGGEGEDALHPGESFSDALAAPGGEGIEGKAGTGFVALAVLG